MAHWLNARQVEPGAYRVLVVTGSPAATMMSWEWGAPHRLETVRVVITDRGMRANGYIIEDGDEPFGASYQILADATGRTRRLTVESDSVDGERHLALTRTPGGPWVVESTAGSKPLFALHGAEDLHLDASSFTPSLSLRRLASAGQPRHTPIGIKVGCISMPGLAVRAVHYEYTFGDENTAYQAGPETRAEMTVDERSFVRDIVGSSHRLP